MAGRDRVQICTAHLKPISRVHVQVTLLELGLLGRELGEHLRVGGACRDVIIIMAGCACSNRYLVPSVCWCLLHTARYCKWRNLFSANGIIPQGAMESK